MNSPDESTFLYLFSHESWGLYKIGIGFGTRLEKWRREGWKLEQQVLFPTREEALFAESLVKRELRLLADPLRGTFLREDLEDPDEGFTEVWPYSWGPVDLNEVVAISDRATWQVRSLFVTGWGNGYADLALVVAQDLRDQGRDTEADELLDGMRRVFAEIAEALDDLPDPEGQPRLRSVDP